MDPSPFSIVESSLPNDLPPSSPPHPNPLPSFWTSNYSSPHNNGTSTGPLPTECDVVIIGSGITGVCAASHLVEGLLDSGIRGVEGRKITIAVVEAREFCGGATGRNGGHLSPSPTYQFKTLQNLYSQSDALSAVKLEDRATRYLVSMCEKEGWNEQVQMTKKGTVHLFKDEASERLVRIELEAAENAGIDISNHVWLTGEEAMSKYGAKTYAALLIPGHNLYPLKLASLIFSRALSKIDEANLTIGAGGCGVELSIYTVCCVESVEPAVGLKPGDVGWEVKTVRGNIKTSKIIFSTNAYTSSLLPQFSTGSNRIIPTRGQVISILPSASQDLHWKTGFSANEGFEYFFQLPRSEDDIEGGGEIILGGARNWAKETDYEYGCTDDSNVNQTVGTALRSYLPRQFERWDGEKVEVGMEWTGIMGFTESGAPKVGRVLNADGKVVEGQYISAGYTGHGMSRAPACAEYIALLVLADLQGKELERPDWMPEYYDTEYKGSRSREKDFIHVERGGEIEERRGWGCLIV